jgi:hypothetical protein
MKHALVVGLVLLYVGFTAFLETDEGSRLVLADLLLLALFVLALLGILGGQGIVMPPVHLAALPLLLVFLVGVPFATFPDRAAVELAAILVGYLGSWAAISLLVGLPEVWISRLCKGYVLVIGSLAAVCLIDFLLMPGLISSRNLGGLQGPFRNTGQAGSFFGLHGAVCVALLMGGLVPRRLVYILFTIVTAFALFATIKRAAGIGFLVGVTLISIRILFTVASRKEGAGFSKAAIGFIGFAGIACLVGASLFSWALDNVPGVSWRFAYKVSEEAGSDFADGFFAENVRATFSAFSDSPLIGVGLDNVRDIYLKYEIHSTYLGILAYGGIFGCLAYILFMTPLVTMLFSGRLNNIRDRYSSTLYYMSSMFIGLIISWGYTYHLRKREFWIFIIFVVVLKMLSQVYRKNKAAFHITSKHSPRAIQKHSPGRRQWA